MSKKDLNLSVEDINLEDKREVSIKLDNLKHDPTRFNLESVVISNLVYDVIKKEGLPCKRKENKKTILNGIELDVKVGSMTAILGPSGAGKTTLLNFMALRVQANSAPRGLYLVNGKPAYQSKPFSRSISYILQEDIFLPYLTVRETLTCAARLKLPKQMTEEDKLNRVEQIMEKLGLKKCADTIVGEPGITKGISGGEKKRLSIGMELITKPSILFVDEPTTGLDSVIAHDVVKILVDLAHNEGVTVITTIHQPSSEIFRLFDNVLLMKDGRVLSYASSMETLEIFKKFGVPCPQYTNPADFLLATSMDRHKKNDEQLQNISKYYHESEAKIINPKLPPNLDKNALVATNEGFNLLKKGDHPEEQKLNEEYKSSRPSWFYKYKVLCYRAFKASLRDPQGSVTAIVMACVMALIIGLIFLRIGKNSQKSIQDRKGAILFVLINLGFSGIQSVVATFAPRRAVFLKEYLSKQYGVSPYYFATLSVALPVQIISPIFFVAITYFLIGFHAAPGNFFFFVAVILIVCVIMNGAGFAIAAGAKDIPMALALVPMIVLPLILLGGFFLNADSVPKYLIWVQYLSPFKYGYELLSIEEYSGRTFICQASELVDGVCPTTTGRQVLQSLSMLGVKKYVNWIVLATLLVVTQILGFLILYWRSRNFKKTGTI